MLACLEDRSGSRQRVCMARVGMNDCRCVTAAITKTTFVHAINHQRSPDFKTPLSYVSEQQR
jgi:hypothetical protein